MKTKLVSQVSSPSRRMKVRDRIVGGAADRFLSQGFSRVTMDRLASDLGVSKKTLYLHFESKEQLLYAVVTGFLDETSGQVEALIGRKDVDVLERLVALMDYLSRRFSRISLVFLEELERFAPDMWQEVQQFRRRRILDNFIRLYRAGLRQGTFAPAPDPQLTAQLFLALVQGVMNPQALSRLPFPPHQVLRAIIAIFLFGTLSEGTRSRRIGRRRNMEVAT